MATTPAEVLQYILYTPLILIGSLFVLYPVGLFSQEVAIATGMSYGAVFWTICGVSCFFGSQLYYYESERRGGARRPGEAR